VWLTGYKGVLLVFGMGSGVAWAVMVLLLSLVLLTLFCIIVSLPVHL